MNAKEKLLKVADFYKDKDLSIPIVFLYTVNGKEHEVYCHLKNDSFHRSFDMTREEYREVFFNNPLEISKSVKEYIARKYEEKNDKAY